MANEEVSDTVFLNMVEQIAKDAEKYGIDDDLKMDKAFSMLQDVVN